MRTHRHVVTVTATVVAIAASAAISIGKADANAPSAGQAPRSKSADTGFGVSQGFQQFGATVTTTPTTASEPADSERADTANPTDTAEPPAANEPKDRSTTTETKSKRESRRKPIVWTPCESNGLECATLSLPVDYENRNGKRFDLAVIRHPARNPAARIGSLVVNNGGPGASPVSFLINTIADPGSFSDEIRDRFDIVGFDPRGVVRSTEVRCSATQPAASTSSRFLLGNESLIPVPPPQSVVDTNLKDAQSAAKDCLDNNDPEFLRNITTRNVAIDMEMLRRALGDKKLTFLGFSYGTYLGVTYSSLFPKRVRALALDGVLDPEKYANEPILLSIEQAGSANQILIDVLEFCKANGSRCPFGNGDPVTAFRKLANDLTENPKTFRVNGQDTQINGVVLRSIARSIVTVPPAAWSGYLDVFAFIQKGPPEMTVSPQMMEAMTSDEPVPAQFESPDAFTATTCNDEDFPRDYGPWEELFEERFLQAPDFGYLDVFRATTCIFYDTHADPFDGPFTADGTPPILFVGGTRDGQTPYSWATNTAALIPNSRLLTFEGYGHVSYRPENTCITEKVDAYLIDGTLPAAGTVCKQPSPQPLK
jgi:pimeloyl-ACP methyl ester carboxylesterase